jgi:hypothetical protein
MNHPLVIDAFPGFNEIALADFRIKYLNDWVDRVVIAESRMTHSGEPKPMYFSEWLAECEGEFGDKVTIIEVPLNELMSNWEREIFTREFLAQFLIDNFPNDFFILSDLDEIPSTDQIKRLRMSSGIFHFNTPTSYRKSNWILVDSHSSWSHGVLGEIANLRKFPNGARFSKLPKIEGEPGGHFSYFGHDSYLMAQKYQSLAHAELNHHVWRDASLLHFCDRYRIDHLGRSRSKGFGLFKVSSNKETSIIEQISNRFPGNFDSVQDLPPRMCRIYASIRLTSYMNHGLISNFKRRILPPSIFFESSLLVFLTPPVLEIIITMLHALRRILRATIEICRKRG